MMTFCSEAKQKIVSLFTLFRLLISEGEINCTDFNNTGLVFLTVANCWIRATPDCRGVEPLIFKAAVQ